MSQKKLLSKTGKTCLTNCYPPSSVYLHPYLLRSVGKEMTYTCAVEPIINLDKPLYLEECDKSNPIIVNELEYIMKGFSFDPRRFLRDIYGIDNFDAAIKWAKENSTLSRKTIERVHNNTWRSLVTRDTELTDEVVDYYYRYFIDNYLTWFSSEILSENSIKLNTDHKYDSFDELVEKKLLTPALFRKAIQNYVASYIDKWDIIESHMDHMRKHILHYILEYMTQNTKN